MQKQTKQVALTEDQIQKIKSLADDRSQSFSATTRFLVNDALKRI